MVVSPRRRLARHRLIRASATALLLLTGACKEPIARMTPLEPGLGGLKLLFRTPYPSPHWSFVSASATDGVRLYADINQHIEAFDAATGARLWSYERPLGGPSALVAVGGRLFLAGDTAAVALDAATGDVLWRYAQLDDTAEFCESAGDLDAFYFGTSTQLYALRSSDGALLWHRDVGADWEHGGVVRGMTVSGDTVYAVVEHDTGINSHIGIGEIYALDRRTGEVFWNFSNGDGTRLSVSQSAARVSGRLLLTVADWENEIFAVDRFTGREVWRIRGEPGYFGPQEPPEVEGTIGYAASADISIKAIDLETGTLRWTSRASSGAGYISVCGNRVLVEDLAITVLDKETGQRLARGYDSSTELPLTDFRVIGNRAYVFTDLSLLAFQCPE